MTEVTISYFKRGSLRPFLENIENRQLGIAFLEAKANGETERAVAIEAVMIHNRYSTDRDEKQEAAAIAKARAEAARCSSACIPKKMSDKEEKEEKDLKLGGI